MKRHLGNFSNSNDAAGNVVSTPYVARVKTQSDIVYLPTRLGSSVTLTKDSNGNIYGSSDGSSTDSSTTNNDNFIIITKGTGSIGSEYNVEISDFLKTKINSESIYTMTEMVDASTLNKSEYVDLDLPSGKLWASCNLGASKPCDIGNHYLWGEITEYTDGEQYKYGSYPNYTKYNSTDGLTNLMITDDAVYQATNGQAYTPTMEDFAELVSNTNNKWCTYSDINTGVFVEGRLFCSKKDSSKRIFIPNDSESNMIAGGVISTGAGLHTSSCICIDSSYLCEGFLTEPGTSSNSYWVICYDREIYNGAVRGIKNKSDDEYVDLGLPSGNLWATCNLGASNPSEAGNSYAWGEILSKNNYYESNYKYGSYPNYTKYNSTDGKISLDILYDDVIYRTTNGRAHIPSYSDATELIKNTKHSHGTYNNVEGMYFISNVDSSKKIFIPDTHDIWTNTLDNVLSYKFGYILTLSDSYAFIEEADRFMGLYVRGVKSLSTM